MLLPPSQARLSEALRRLQTTPRRSIALAKSGSYDDMYAIVDVDSSYSNVRFRYIPKTLETPLYEMFCSHLQNVEPSSGSDEARQLQVFLVSYSILGLWLFSEGNPSRCAEPQCKRYLKRAWPGMLDWIQRLGETELRNFIPGEIVCFPLFFQCAFEMIEMHKDFKTLLASEKVSAFVTRMWLREDWSLTNREIPLISMAFWRYSCGSACICAHHKGNAVLKTIKAGGFRLTDVVVLALRRLRTAMDSLDIEAASYHIRVIAILCHRCDRSQDITSPCYSDAYLKFTAAFSRVHGVSEIINALQKLDLRSKTDRYNKYDCCLALSQKSFELLAHALQVPNHAQYYIKASLKKSLFDTFLCTKYHDMGQKESHNDHENYPLFLFDTLYPPFLSIPSIANRASKALMSLFASNQDAFLHIPEYVRPTWDAFVDLLAERRILGSLLSLRAKRFRCDNPMCRRVGPRGTFKTCASCSEVVYCSVSCQETDWRLYGHKELCEAYVEFYSRPTLLTRSDRRYLKELAAMEISRHSLALHEHASVEFGMSDDELDFVELGFLVDFTDYPPTICVIPFPEDVDFSDSGSQTEFSRITLQSILASSARQYEASFIEIHVPTGGSGHEKLLCIEHTETFLCEPIVDRLEQSERITEALRTGLASGGSTRRACWGEEFIDLDVIYDEVDELMRRLRLDCARLAKPLFDEGVISAVVDQYMLGVGDSTPARFS